MTNQISDIYLVTHLDISCLITVVIVAFLSLYMLLFSYPSVVYLSCYLVIFFLQFILLLFCAHCLYTRALPFTHTLIRSLSDDPEFVRPDIGRFVSIVQVFDETIHIARSLSLSLILVFLSLLSSCYFLILPLSHSVAIFFPLFICYHYVRYLYVLLQ